MDNFFDSLQPVLLAALTAVITAAAGAIGLAIRAWVEQRVGREKYAAAVDIVTTAVTAAEQQMGDGQGAAKKSEATALAQSWLDERGIKLSAEQIAALIEQAVYSALSGLAPAPVPVVVVEPTEGMQVGGFVAGQLEEPVAPAVPRDLKQTWGGG